MRNSNHLVVFVKAPRLGTVKGRLARDIGTVAAWSFYRRVCAAVLRRLTKDRRWRCWLAITPDTVIRAPGIWPPGVAIIPQGRGDLGRRMDRALRFPPAGPVVIVGTDIPAIRPRHIAQAFKALGHNDAVFGSAKDGGYWLVGLRRRPAMAYIFKNVRWSTEHALADTLANLPGGFKTAMVETLGDVDDGSAYATLEKI